MPEMQVGLSECSAPQARRGESGTPLATPAVAGEGWPCAASAYAAASCPLVVALPPEAPFKAFLHPRRLFSFEFRNAVARCLFPGCWHSKAD